MRKLRVADEIDRPNYHLVNSHRVFEDLLRSVSNTKRLSFDYETSDPSNENYLQIAEKKRPIDPINNTVTSASFRTSDGKCYYLSVDHRNSFNMPKEAIKDVLLAKPREAPTCAHNMVFEWTVSKQCLDLDLRDIGPLRDTMLAAKLLDSNQFVGLKDLVRRNLGILQTSYASTTDGKKMCEISAERAFRYGCDDSEFQWQLEEILDKHLHDHGLWDYYLNIEMPLAPIIAEMTLEGAWVDPELIKTRGQQALDKMAELERDIIAVAGTQLNLNSPQQLSRLIYQTLGLPRPPYAESKTATDKESLYWNIHLHPIMPIILEYKKYATRYKLYYKPYPLLIHPDTGRIHSQLRQTVADTGRFASSQPNLQQLAKRGDGIEVREIFSMPAGLEGNLDRVMAQDMSQVELVIAGHRAKCKELLETYTEHNRGDVHTKTTCAMFGISPEEAKTNKIYRQAGKTGNFSLLYGGAAKRIYRLIKLELAKMNLECPFSIRDVEVMIANYFNLYPEIRQMQRDDVARALGNGYVKSLYGRRFYLPDIRHRSGYIRSKAERKATNSPIQGTCAELMKLAIINIYNERIPKEDFRMWASVHDEIVTYVNSKKLKDIAPVVNKHVSFTPNGLRAFMASDCEVGHNFGQLSSYDWRE